MISNTAVSYAFEERGFVSKMTRLLKECECSNNLMVGIYLVEVNHFFYCNNQLKEVLGNNFGKVSQGGWNFLYSMMDDPSEVELVKNQISNFLTRPYSDYLLTLKYTIRSCCGKTTLVKHEILLHQVEEHFIAINYFFDITEKEKIEHCIGTFPECIDSHALDKNILTISPREKQVLRLIGDGYSSKEIADILFISNHTAISHRKNLIEKFKVKNTAHLIKKASVSIKL